MAVRNADKGSQYGTNSAHKLCIFTCEERGQRVSVWHKQCTQTEVTACNYEVYINERDQMVKTGGQRMQKLGGNTTVLSP